MVKSGVTYVAKIGTNKVISHTVDKAKSVASERLNVQSSSPKIKNAIKSNDYVNLASSTRTNHILFGDVTGGGHLYPGLNGKSHFPASWNSNKIMHYISDIATDPKIPWKQITGKAGSSKTKQGSHVRFEAVGIRKGITIKTIIEPGGEGIITGYPLY